MFVCVSYVRNSLRGKWPSVLVHMHSDFVRNISTRTIRYSSPLSCTTYDVELDDLTTIHSLVIHRIPVSNNVFIHLASIHISLSKLNIISSVGMRSIEFATNCIKSCDGGVF
uniref:Uncharacterized protein n=1 Tax=Glossina pallidipes TaxID=7398 RepID=A0A1B0A880_GLOPL